MSTVSTVMTSLLTEDCSRFLPPQHRTLDHRLFEDVSVAQQDPQTLSTGKIGDMAQAVTQIRGGLGAYMISRDKWSAHTSTQASAIHGMTVTSFCSTVLNTAMNTAMLEAYYISSEWVEFNAPLDTI